MKSKYKLILILSSIFILNVYLGLDIRFTIINIIWCVPIFMEWIKKTPTTNELSGNNIPVKSNRIVTTLVAKTINDNQAELFLQGTNNQRLEIPNNTAWKFTADLIAIFSNGNTIGSTFSRQFQGVVKNIDGISLALDNIIPPSNFIIQSAQESAFNNSDASIWAEDISDALVITVFPPSGTTDTIKWLASVELIEIKIQ